MVKTFMHYDWLVRKGSWWYLTSIQDSKINLEGIEIIGREAIHTAQHTESGIVPGRTPPKRISF